MLMQHYEPPVLACALNEVLNKIAGGDPSSIPTLLVPFLVESSKVKGYSKSLRSDESRALTFGIQIGHTTDIMQTLLKKTQETPSSLQIQQENFACFLHFVRVMKLPTFFLIGQSSTKQHEVFIFLTTFKAHQIIGFLEKCQIDFWLPFSSAINGCKFHS